MNQDLHTKDRGVKVTDRDILHAEKDGFSQNCDTFGACGLTVHVQVAFVLCNHIHSGIYEYLTSSRGSYCNQR